MTLGVQSNSLPEPWDFRSMLLTELGQLLAWQLIQKGLDSTSKIECRAYGLPFRSQNHPPECSMPVDKMQNRGISMPTDAHSISHLFV